MHPLLSIIEKLVPAALALTITDAMDTVGGALPTGGGNFGDIAFTVATSFTPIILAAAVLAVMISGFFLTVTGNENQQTTAKRVFISGVAAIILVNVGATLRNALISGGFGFSNTSLTPSGSTILTDPLTSGRTIGLEATGLLDYLAIPLGIICIIMIIVSGVRAIGNLGSEEGVTQLRRTVIFVVTGFIIVLTRYRLAGTVTIVGTTVVATPTNIIDVMVTIGRRILSLILVLAVAVLVYAGALMVVNIGNDEQYGQAKNLMIRVAIGFIVLAASSGIAAFLAGII